MTVKKGLPCVIVALALLPAATAAPSRTARLAITDLSPFTVHGLGFAGREQVKIIVEAKQRSVRRVVASARGTFTAQVPAVRIEKCGSYVVRAVGNLGSAATRKVVPTCPPPSDEPPALNPADLTPTKR